MTLRQSLYLTVAGRGPQRHATLPTHRIVHSTTPYYKVLLQHYSVLQSTTPVLLCTTMNYSVLCTTKFYSRTNLYYKVLLQYYKVTLMIDTRYIWNVIYNTRSNECHPPTSPNTAPATQNDSHAWWLGPRHIWNVIYNARGNRCHPPTSPNTAPATQNDPKKSDRSLLKTGETSFAVRGRFLLLDSTRMYPTRNHTAMAHGW